MEIYEQIIDQIEEMLNTTTSVMAPYPVDVVGRPAPFGKKISKKKARKEKRAPHTEMKITEECEKQSKGKQKKAMLGYKYKKSWGNPIREISELCEEIIRNCR